MWKPIVVLVVAAGCIVAGVSMWSIPGALIVTGILLGLFAFVWDWAEPDRRT